MQCQIVISPTYRRSCLASGHSISCIDRIGNEILSARRDCCSRENQSVHITNRRWPMKAEMSDGTHRNRGGEGGCAPTPASPAPFTVKENLVKIVTHGMAGELKVR